MMINRDAGDKFKGLTLQKVRAVYSVLKALNTSQKKVDLIYFAIEADDDIQIVESTEGKLNLTFEQNKDLQSKGVLTINSTDVYKSLINFIDIWIRQRESDSIKFVFYTTCNIGKEQTSKVITELELSLPEEPVINIIKSSEIDDGFLEDFFVPYMSEVYRKAYESHDKSYIGIISEWDLEKWKSFLNRIEWVFLGRSVDKIDEEIISEITKCDFYNVSLVGKEKAISARIEQELERRMANDDYVSRFLHLSDIKLIFKEAESDDIDFDDITGEILDQIDVTDTRDVQQKINSVCPSASGRVLNHYKILASEALLVERSQKFPHPFKSQKYQIYTAVQDYIIRNSEDLLELNEKALIGVLDSMCDLAIQRVKVDKADFRYPVNDDQSIRNMVFGLLDQCYIAFDGEVSIES